MAAADSNITEPRWLSMGRYRWKWIIALAIAMIAAVAYFSISRVRELTVYDGHRGFRAIAIALSNYKDVFDGHLPPPQSDSPGYSWRFGLEPFIEGPGVHGMDGALPWTDPRYASWASLRHRCYSFGAGESRNTNVLAVVGTDTAWNADGK